MHIMQILFGIWSWWALEGILSCCMDNRDAKSAKRVANWVSCTHSILASVLCACSILSNAYLQPYTGNSVVSLSVSYFLYDIRNYKAGTFYHAHHVFSIISIMQGFLHVNQDTYWSYFIYMATELGNLPIYIMCELIYNPNRGYLREYEYRVLLAELGFFALFRIIVASVAASHLTLLPSWGIFCVLQSANLVWIRGIYSKIVNYKQ